MTTASPAIANVKKTSHWATLFAPLLAVAIYLPTLTHGPITDDVSLIVENPFLQSREGLWALLSQDLWSASALLLPTQYYRPIPMLSYWLQVQLLGNSVLWLRLGNLLIFAATAWLLRCLILAQFRKVSERAATIITALWVVHPMNTEPVVWLSGRFDLALGLFVLSAMASNVRSHRVWSVPIWFGAALLSKEVAICLVPVLLVQDLTSKIHLRREAPKYALLALLLASYLLARKALGIASATAVLTNSGLPALAQSYATLISVYGSLLIWPTGFDVHHWYSPSSIAWALLVVALLAGLALSCLYALYRRSALPAYATGIVLVATSLVPPALIGPNQLVYGDRFAYLAWLGICVSIPWLLPRVAPKLRPYCWYVAAALAACWAFSTQVRSSEWRSQAALQQAALKRWPQHPHWRALQANTLLDEGQSQQALTQLLPLTKQLPDYAKAWNLLCVAQIREGLLRQAEISCTQSCKLLSEKPKYFVNLATVYVNQSRWDLALAPARRALQFRPRYAEALYLVAIASANLGDFATATHAVSEGLLINPEHTSLKVLRLQLTQHFNASTNTQ